MIATSPEQLSFLASIRESPDDDTIRLAYADFLDSQDTASVKCPKCKGMGRGVVIAGLLRFEDIPDEPGLVPRLRKDCPTCKGTGFVPDTSNADRAELIRVQCESATLEGAWKDTKPAKKILRRKELKARESALLTANADRWRAGPTCEKCGGKKAKDIVGGQRACSACFGTGDAGGLTKKFFYPPPGFEPEDGLTAVDLSVPVRVTYSRGMKVVTVPHAMDCWEQWGTYDPASDTTRNERYRPTAWASAVCRSHPDVEQVVIAELRPTREEGGWEWYGLPDFLNVTETKQTFATEAAAVTALARTVARWIHNHLDAHKEPPCPTK